MACRPLFPLRRAGRLVAVASAVTVGLLVAGCGADVTGALARPGVVDVVAGENVWGDIAAQIGGSHAVVTSIITSPTADPHLYQSDAADAVSIAAARIVILNGAGYDDFMTQLLGASGTHPIVVSAEKVLGVGGANPNPHFWYDIPKVPAVAAAIEAALARAEPSSAALFRRNLATFDASLRPVLAVLSTIKARYPGAPVAYTERVPAYLLAAAGLRSLTPPGFATAIESGNDPSLADTEAMYSLIARRAIKVLLYNTQTTSAVTAHVRALAAQAGIPVVGVSEILPTTDGSFQAWQLVQARALLTALGR